MPDPKDIRAFGRDIYSADFAAYLPDTLKRDTKMKALAAAVTEQMLGVSRNIENVLLYARIDELPEELIDILAYDMHVDWYDYSYPLDIKRNILKNSVKVHKKMGTKYAVETALRDVHKGAGVSEWFEYGGKPYHFKINVDISRDGMTEKTGSEITAKVNFYKNLRSHCDGIYYHLGMDAANVSAAAFTNLGATLKVKPYTVRALHTADTLMIFSDAAIGGSLKVKAHTDKSIKVSVIDAAKVLSTVSFAGILKVKAYVTDNIHGKAAKAAVPADISAVNSMKVKPDITENLKAAQASAVKPAGYQRMKNIQIIGKEGEHGS